MGGVNFLQATRKHILKKKKSLVIRPLNISFREWERALHQVWKQSEQDAKLNNKRSGNFSSTAESESNALPTDTWSSKKSETTTKQTKSTNTHTHKKSFEVR
jgi:cytoskeletal protein RodZ